MFDKIKTLDCFRQKTKDSFETMFYIIKSSFRNLILINYNTPYVKSWIVTRLTQNKLTVNCQFYDSIIKSSSLGDFLRYESNVDTKDVLLLDFSSIEKQSKKFQEIADEININRDLFTKRYNSVIFLTSPDLTFAIKNSAIDFTSCIDLFIDTTKWFCSPNTIPLVKIRTYGNTTQYLINAFESNPSEYNKYSEIKNKIKNISVYTNDIIRKTIEKIEEFPEGIYYYELLILLVETITKKDIPPKLQLQRVKDLKALTFRNKTALQLVDVHLILADFFYKSCEYDEAILRYRTVLQTLNELFANPYIDSIAAFLQCNIVVCNYVKNNNHSPFELLDNLKLRLNQGNVFSSEKYSNFASIYLFLIKSTYMHHGYIQHKELFLRLTELTLENPPMCDLTEEFNQILSWEYFINNPSNLSIPPSTTQLSFEIQKMVVAFCNGNYKLAHSLYKTANYMAKSYSHMQLSNYLKKFQYNMHFLYTNK